MNIRSWTIYIAQAMIFWGIFIAANHDHPGKLLPVLVGYLITSGIAIIAWEVISQRRS